MAKSRRQQSLPGMEPEVPTPNPAPVSAVGLRTIPTLRPVSFSLADAIESQDENPEDQLAESAPFDSNDSSHSAPRAKSPGSFTSGKLTLKAPMPASLA